MITLSTIPARHHAALAAARVDTNAGPLVDWCDDGDAVVYTRDFGARRYDTDALTLPATDHNARALAVVFAEACGLDVSGGVLADFVVVLPRPMLRLRMASGGGWLSGPLRDINPTDPDARCFALCAALCALETA